MLWVTLSCPLSQNFVVQWHIRVESPKVKCHKNSKGEVDEELELNSEDSNTAGGTAQCLFLPFSLHWLDQSVHEKSEVWVHVFVYMCVYVCMFVCVNAYEWLCVRLCAWSKHAYVYARLHMHSCVCKCEFVCRGREQNGRIELGSGSWNDSSSIKEKWNLLML